MKLDMRGALVMNMRKHERWKTEPRSRPHFLLREAVARCAVHILDYEWLANPNFKELEERPVWFEILVEAYGRKCAIFLRDPHCDVHIQHWKQENFNARTRKIQYAMEHGIPFCEVRATSQSKMQAQVELWLATMSRQPYMEALPKSKWMDPDPEPTARDKAARQSVNRRGR